VIDRESYKKVVGGFFQSGVRMSYREFFIDTSFIWYRGGVAKGIGTCNGVWQSVEGSG